MTSGESQEAESCSMASSWVCLQATLRNHQEGTFSGLRVLSNRSHLLADLVLKLRRQTYPDLLEELRPSEAGVCPKAPWEASGHLASQPWDPSSQYF